MIKTYPIEAGLFIRGQIRALVVQSGLDYLEQKGLLGSLFTVGYNDESQFEMDRIRKLDTILKAAPNGNDRNN